MNILFRIIIFIIVLFFYIHINFHYKFSNDLELYDINAPTKDRINEICDLKQPVTFYFQNDNINIITSKYLLDNYKSFNLNLKDNSLNTITITTKNFFEGKYNNISKNNYDYLQETTIIDKLKSNDSFLRPNMLFNFYYDIIIGNKSNNTDLIYEINYRNYFLLTEGKAKIKLIPPKNKKYLNIDFDYENMVFISDTNVWNNENILEKIKYLEIDLQKNTIINIPAYWLYTIQILEDKTTIINFKYQTYMNSLSNINYHIKSILQKQNIKYKLINDRN